MRIFDLRQVFLSVDMIEILAKLQFNIHIP